MPERKIELGTAVKDKVTGFVGFVTGIVEYLTGCTQCLVQPRCKADGSYAENHWFDIDRLEPSRISVSDTEGYVGKCEYVEKITIPVKIAGADTEAPRK